MISKDALTATAHEIMRWIMKNNRKTMTLEEATADLTEVLEKDFSNLLEKIQGAAIYCNGNYPCEAGEKLAKLSDDCSGPRPYRPRAIVPFLKDL